MDHPPPFNKQPRLVIQAPKGTDDRPCGMTRKGAKRGAQKGTDAYVNCRAQLEGARRQSDGARAATRSAERPSNCIVTTGYGGGSVICN